MNHKTTRYVISLTALAAFGIAWADEPAMTDIPPQPLNEALRTFADQSGLQMVYRTELAEGIETNGTDSPETDSEALDQLLASTGLEHRFVNDRTVSIQIAASEDEDSGPGKTQPASSQVLMAQNQTSEAQNQGTNRASTTNDMSSEEQPLEIEEIIVTGSNIRGVENSAAPVFTFDRDDIDRSGYPTVNQFLQTIPQNFGGGPNENTAGGSSPATVGSSEPGQVSGINLRGLGPSSTLTLLNGRRLAPAGVGSVVDVTSIPTSAIERIEVLTDGASAIYGSDAVGGVVNIILRRDFEGAETIIRHSPDLGGDVEDFKFSQTFGKKWDRGNALVTYERYDRSELNANDRGYAAESDEPQTLLPDISRDSVFASIRHDLSQRVELSSDAYYNTRDVKSASARTSIPIVFDEDAVEYGANIQAAFFPTEDWRVALGGTYSYNDFEGESVQAVDGVSRGVTTFDYSVTALDVSADGPIASMPGGQMMLAVGGQHRKEDLSEFLITSTPPISRPGLNRDVTAVFGELFLPLIGEGNRTSGTERLEVTLAVRYEDYSDFGTTTNPKVGLLWSPLDGLNFRSTWGTSFRAPLLREISGSTVNAIFFPVTDPVLLPGGGTVPTLLITSNFNPNLGPEEATTWTAGIDIEPPSVPGLDIELTYFDIAYDDRIQSPFTGSIFSALNPEFVSLVPRDPSPELVQSLLDQTTRLINPFGILQSDIRAIADNRPINLASVDLSGIDILARYTTQVSSGELAFSVGGTYQINWDREIVPGLDFDDLNKVFNPIDLRLRASVSWQKDNFSSALFVNHLGDSVNNQITPEEDIDSWTTVDLNLRYMTPHLADNGWADGLTLSLNVVNILDEDPPFVDNPGSEVNFDGTNANALGRFVSFQIAKRW